MFLKLIVLWSETRFGSYPIWNNILENMFEIHDEDLSVGEHIMFGDIDMYTDMVFYDCAIS